MLYDVLTALHHWKQRPQVAIVTSDPYATKLAAEYQFEVIPDPENPGETGAIEMATQVCVERGVEYTLVIPADIPLIQGWELEEILKHAPAEGSVLVPAGDGRGTNAAFRRPADLFPLRFGNESFKPHHAAAKATGKPCIVLEPARHCRRYRQSRRPATVGLTSRRNPRAKSRAQICLRGSCGDRRLGARRRDDSGPEIRCRPDILVDEQARCT